ncbi:MAG: hypothetical protein RL514_4516 [Verrucomicrobiota bacterium]
MANAFLDVNSLGYCTPEFVSVLPSALSECTAALRQSEQGTLFCFHLRSEARAEVQRRISGQAHEVYELCPLFLPNLSLVQLGPNTLRIVANRTPTADLPGTVEADKVILTTRAPNQPQSHSRFWRLRGVAPGDLWQLALHADGQHRLRLDLEDDEQGVTLKEGSAYAFFPLNGMNQTWPFRLHLHSKLPTKLERDNWNPADAADVEDQLRRAVRGMVAWLETQMDMLAHGEWGFERLVNQKPAPPMNEGDWPAKWANVIFGELLKAVEERPLLRSVFGRRVLKAEAQRIEVVQNQASRDSWSQLASARDLGGELPAFVPAGTAVFGITAARPDEIGEPFGAILSRQTVSAANRRVAILAYLSTNSHSTRSLERAFEGALVERADGEVVKLGDLMAEPCGTELSPEWHSCFARLTEWGRDAVWQSAHVFNGRLPDQFRKLSTSVFNPPWAELSARLGSLEAWQTHGEQFWRNPRRPCPPQFLASALACLHVPSGDGGWLPLSKLWLDDDAADCFAELLTAWPLSYINAERQRITSLLKDWGLFAEWERTTQVMLKEKLPGELTRRLTDKMTGDAFAAVFSQAFQDARSPLDGRWAHIINEGEKTAVSRFVRARATEQKLLGKTVLSASIAANVRAALCLDAGFVLAPPWLTAATHNRICHLGLQENLGFKFLSQQEFSKQRETLIRELLEHFHHWKDSAPTPDALAGLDEMAAITSRANRRNWPLGLSSQKKPLLKELIHSQSSEADANPAEQLNRLLLQKVDWRNAEPLPALLAQVPSVAEVCVQPHKLQLEVPDVPLTPIEFSQIPSTALEEPAVRALVEAGKHHFFTSTRALKLRWLQDGEVVATLPAADYVVDGDKLIFAHSLPPAELEPYQNILRAYEDNDRGSAEYRHDKEAGVSAYERFQKYRPVITKVLVESRVRAFGYQEQHILRELLQNAESAYASKQESGLPAEPWFELAVTRLQGETGYRVTAMHEGRAFDEPDKHGNPRPDVDRIIMESAPAQNTEDEVGRFNRGFKSVFCAARDKRVRVESGGFDFVVQDLMLRFPPKPERSAGPANPVTKFTFEASRQDALALLDLKEPLGANSSLPLINASSLVFLRHISRVTVSFEDHKWTWKTTPGRNDGWQEVSVGPCGGCPSERFLVYHAPRSDAGERFAAALRLGPAGLPRKLEQSWRCLRLTFETDEAFSLDVLVNGQFEAEFGRRKLIKIPESGLVDQSFATVIQRCSQDFAGANVSKERWLAWAGVLNLKNRMAGLANRAANAKAIANQVEEFLNERIPHGGTLKAAADLDFPSNLMRRLSLDGFCARWGIDTSNWIDPEIAAELPNTKQDELGLDDWLRNARLNRPRLQEIQDAIEARQFRPIAEAFSAEITKAKQLLQLRLRPARGFQVENWQAAELLQRWQEDNEKANGRLLDDYTLEGANWTLLYPSDSTPMAGRKDKLRHDLAHEDTAERSLRVWYRLFGLACLMSARGRTETLRTFWKEELEASGFWDATCDGRDFDDATRDLFKNLVLREFRDAQASGEWADYWRRVFYDIRKVHELVWQHDFVDTVLRLAFDPERARELPQFLRSGRLAEQKPWAGVLGQSAGAPLFFVVRELCRLGAIPPLAMDSVRPLAFFACTPVRRAAVRIGWLDSSLAARTDFKSLAEVSRRLFERISSDTSVDAITRQQLLNLYDIPLLHLGLNG